MPRRVVYSNEARLALRDVFRYSRATWGENGLRAYRAAIQRTVDSLTRYPELGTARDEFGVGMRTLAVKSHVLVYSVQDGSIMIHQILHQRMAPPDFDDMN